MGWREQMQPASFRGVPFKVKSTDGQVGRRTVSHEYPGKDVPYVEDMGRRAREYSIEAFVIGDDYMRARDALIAALEQSGPGELVHPYHGRLKVAVPNGRWSQSPDEGGMARFSITFQETGDIVQPTVRADTQGGVEVAADAAAAASELDFGGAFTVDKLPEFVGAGALGNIAAVLDKVSAVASSMLTDTAVMPDFIRQLSTMSGQASSLIRTPYSLANNLFSQISRLRAIALKPADAWRSLYALNDFGSAGSATAFPSIPASTPARIRQANNQTAITTLVQRAALIEAARASSAIEFTSYDEALATRDILVERLDNTASTAPDPVYFTMTDLRVAVIKDITARGADLSRIVRYTPRGTLPALVLAHQLYGDAARADEIVARNRIPHPGFVRGGQALEVLA